MLPYRLPGTSDAGRAVVAPPLVGQVGPMTRTDRLRRAVKGLGRLR